ncbi:hypothetical protein BLGI_2023 [Brevibacillus laterosporus GI-9]|nr:hypothetical protein BLGI_2023 [Brevibacillus laterosporus GI-9]
MKRVRSKSCRKLLQAYEAYIFHQILPEEFLPFSFDYEAYYP